MQPPKNLRIFLISNMFPSNKDPLFGIFVKNFKTQLEELGVQFTRTSLIYGKSRHIPGKICVYFRHFSRILLFSFKKDYGLVYIHYFSHHIPVLWPFFLWNKKPVVINVHGSDILGVIHNNMLRKISVHLLKSTNLLVVPTEYFKDLILRNFPQIKESAIYVSPSGGIDRSLFKSYPAASTDKVLTIGFVSRFIEEKGWRVFLDALVQLQQRNIKFSGLIVGKGPDEQLIKNYIKEKRLDKFVQVLGFVPQERLPGFYNQLDLYAFPTYREAESLGLTGLEAMSCGVPVIGSDMAGPSTYIKDGYNGFLFPPRDATALADKIALFQKMSHAERKNLSLRAEQTSTQYDRVEVARKLYHRLLALPGI